MHTHIGAKFVKYNAPHMSQYVAAPNVAPYRFHGRYSGVNALYLLPSPSSVPPPNRYRDLLRGIPLFTALDTIFGERKKKNNCEMA